MTFVSEESAMAHNLRAHLREKLLPLASGTGTSATPRPELTVVRFDGPARSEHCWNTPAIRIVLQGSAHTVVGNEAFRCGARSCLINDVSMPSVTTICDASPDKPFLAVALAIDHVLATELSAEIPLSSTAGAGSYSGVSVAEVAPELLDAFSRLVDALDNPDGMAVLAPMVIREIHYRVLIGPQGSCLRLLSTVGSHGNQIAEAITWLREHVTTPFHVAALAARVSMATTTFHRHFKQITSMSPLQFQKRLRLYEAQRLMLAEDKDASSACLAVGYESPTQFNREYKRFFGEPPHRNIARLRQTQLP